MESSAGKAWLVATVAIVLVLCTASMSVTWHCVNEVAKLQSRVARLEADNSGSSVSTFLSQLGVHTAVYQGDNAEEEVPGHLREVRHAEITIDDLVTRIVRRQLVELLDCSIGEDHANCTSIEPGPKGDPGPPGPQGEKGEQGETGHQGYPGFKGQKGEEGVQGYRGKGEKGDMGPRGPVGDKGEKGKIGPIGIQGQKGEKGHIGYPGFKGQKGDEGYQGVRGPKGDTGAQGPRGPKGQPGGTGPKGQKGAMGEKGQLGFPGHKGEKGAMGEQGVGGEKGENGALGVQGPKGEKGTASGTYVGPYSCGGTTGWTRVAYLDMTNSDHQCPGDMVEVTVSGKRLCGRSTSPSCASATFSSYGLQYSQVCGRTTGYQFRAAQGFKHYHLSLNGTQSIESNYVVGASVTHGPPGSRQHVWTFANGHNEAGIYYGVCPCAPNAPSDIRVPPFVGQDYFCEAGLTSVDGIAFQLYSDDPLWDGDGCTIAGNTCCEFNNPPYFTKQLTSPTTDNLEVRVCRYLSREERGDTLIELIELYVR